MGVGTRFIPCINETREAVWGTETVSSRHKRGIDETWRKEAWEAVREAVLGTETTETTETASSHAFLVIASHGRWGHLIGYD